MEFLFVCHVQIWGAIYDYRVRSAQECAAYKTVWVRQVQYSKYPAANFRDRCGKDLELCPAGRQIGGARSVVF